jgi:3-methyladenine DNA glycosylase AlkC
MASSASRWPISSGCSAMGTSTNPGFFTRHGSAEFAVREFLRRDLHRTLRVMGTWSRDEDEHVRRLASEGCRPRLPWSLKLGALIADPAPVGPILDNLRADPSAYVRKSVAKSAPISRGRSPGRFMTGSSHGNRT